MAVDLEKECEETKKIIDTSNASQKRVKAVKRIEILEAFRKSGNRPEWMVFNGFTRASPRTQTYGPARRRQVCFVRPE